MKLQEKPQRSDMTTNTKYNYFSYASKLIFIFVLTIFSSSSFAKLDYFSDSNTEIVVNKFIKTPSDKNLLRFKRLIRESKDDWNIIMQRLQHMSINAPSESVDKMLILLQEGLVEKGYPEELWANAFEWNGNTVFFDNKKFDLNILNISIKETNKVGMKKGLSPAGHDSLQIHVCRLLSGSSKYWIEIPRDSFNQFMKDLMLREDDFGLCWNPLEPSKYWSERVESIKPYYH